MTRSPKISVVIPCYNGAAYLADAIESCLRQTLRDFEVIVVDDASPDTCAEIAESFARKDPRVQVIRRAQNGGVAEGFNTGFRAARGSIFTRLAQDDVFLEDALATFVSTLEAQRDVGLCYGDYENIDETGTRLRKVVVPEPGEALTLGNSLGLCVAWRRTVWEEIGGFNPEFDTAEDYEYWLRIWNRFPIAKTRATPQILIRCHQQMTSVHAAERQGNATLRILRDHYPRHLPPLRRQLLRRKALARTYFSMASTIREEGRNLVALSRVLHSIALWPIPFRPHEENVGLARLRFVTALVARSGGLFRPPRSSKETSRELARRHATQK